jgi:hypothetical protein
VGYFRNFPVTVQSKQSQIHQSGTDVMILKIFSPKNLAKILPFLLKLQLVFAKI